MAKEDFSAANLSKINGKEEDQLPSDEPQPPFIDFSLLNSSPSSPESRKELDKFKSALSSWGCFQLINHGIPRGLLDEITEISRQFFGLRMEEKKKYAALPGGNNGFDSAFDGGSSNYQGGGGVVSDWNEGLALTVYPEHGRLPQFWPESPLQLRKMLHEYTMKSINLFEVLFNMVLQSLSVDEKKFGEKYGKNKEINARFNFYPQCPNPDNVLGLKPHADFSAITIVVQGEAGLQVHKDGEWCMVPVIPDALFVNIGDPLEIMSNGIYKSAVHRVVPSPERSRVSIALFWDSDRNCEIGPLDELITPDRPQLYERVSLKDYVSRFSNYYQNGQRVIDTIRT